MTPRETAIGIIDSRIEKLVHGADNQCLHSETSMAVEMAYALGAIELIEHRRYVQLLDYIFSRNAEASMARMRSFG